MKIIHISVSLPLFLCFSFHPSFFPSTAPSFGRLTLVNQQHFYHGIPFCGMALPYLMALMTVYVASLKCSLLHFFPKIRKHFTFLCSAYQMLETWAIFYSRRLQYRQVTGQWCVLRCCRRRTRLLAVSASRRWGQQWNVKMNEVSSHNKKCLTLLEVSMRVCKLCVRFSDLFDQ